MLSVGPTYVPAGPPTFEISLCITYHCLADLLPKIGPSCTITAAEGILWRAMTEHQARASR